ncbi:MAG: winged helix-turn-helix domain-containing protein, partial [Ilumatobacter sp.]
MTLRPFDHPGYGVQVARKSLAGPLQGDREKLKRIGASTELRVLGGLALNVDGVARPIGGPKSQQLLSVLVAHAGQPVSSDRLVEALWADRRPRSATATVQTRLSRLRSVLRPGFVITLEPAGYQLDTAGGEIDAVRFEELLARS